VGVAGVMQRLVMMGCWWWQGGEPDYCAWLAFSSGHSLAHCRLQYTGPSALYFWMRTKVEGHQRRLVATTSMLSPQVGAGGH
jgi:hypothetical protein